MMRDMSGQVNKIGQIYREIIEEANRPFKVVVVGRDRVGKSELAAWFLMGNPVQKDVDIDVFTLVDLKDTDQSVDEAMRVCAASDLIVYVIDASKKVKKSEVAVWHRLKALKKPLILVANKADLAKDAKKTEEGLRIVFNAGPSRFVMVSALEGINIEKGFIPKIAHLAKDFETPLARRFPILRAAVASRIIQRTAAENTVIGALVFLPGADMPVMTANQIRMIMRLAIVYGQELGLERIKELLAVLGSGFAFRSLARQVVGFVPVLGWAVKGGVAYGGTVALGKAAIKYFERIEEIAGDQIEVLPETIKLLETDNG